MRDRNSGKYGMLTPKMTEAMHREIERHPCGRCVHKWLADGEKIGCQFPTREPATCAHARRRGGP